MLSLSDIQSPVVSSFSSEESSQPSHFSFLFAIQPSELELPKKVMDEILGKFEERAIQAFRQGELFLFDALGGNDQCHLVALMIAKIYQRFQEGVFKAAGKERSEENRLIQLAFVLSALFFRNKENTFKLLFPKEEPTVIKSMARFIGHPSIMQAGKQQLARMIDRYVQESLKSLNEKTEESSELLSELTQLSKEDLALRYKHAESGLYCYPKFAGVLLLIENLAKTPFPIVFKIKVLCAKGQHLQVYRTAEDGRTLVDISTHPSTVAAGPAIVVEGFAANKKLSSMDDYKLARAFCPYGLFSDKAGSKIKFRTEHSEKIDRIHSNESACNLCLPCPDADCSDLRLQTQQLAKIQATAHDILRMIGADFTLECQPEYMSRFFKAPSAYPFLSRLFHDIHHLASESGLTARNPSTFLIEHVYPDNLEHALTTPRLLDSHPAELIQKKEEK